ncbi:MAG: homocysteine S-methyltransferase family protein [Myxococcota bacterium]
MILLDGAVGTALEAAGYRADGPAWTAAACDEAPELLSAVHAAYAAAGATVHTANTFRTTPRGSGTRWEGRLRRSLALARAAVPPGHRIAGSLAPLEDCWHPERSPPHPDAELRDIAAALLDAGADLVLCETFSHPGEALAAVRAGVATGAPTWLALTAGPRADLLAPGDLGEIARRAVDLGAEAVLVNCVPALRVGPYLAALGGLDVPRGVYANAGDPADGLGWGAPDGPARYAEQARAWARAGATLIGGCCGTGPDHVRALAAASLR